MFENLGHELDEMRVVVDDGMIDSASNIADGTFPRLMMFSWHVD